METILPERKSAENSDFSNPNLGHEKLTGQELENEISKLEKELEEERAFLMLLEKYLDLQKD